MTVTKLENIINPQVMGNFISAKLQAVCKLTPYAKVDTTLQGVPGDTKTVPCWNYIGDAEDYDAESGKEIETVKLTASTKNFTIKCAMKSVGIFQKAINSGFGDPVGQANIQLVKSMAQKIDNDLMDCCYEATTVVKHDGVICYNGIVDASTKFGDEENDIEKVMFINPNQEADLLKDPSFLSADKFEAGVAVRGSIGKIAGAWIKKSKKVKLVEGKYRCPIIKLEPDSPETEETEEELPALTIFLKEDVQVDHEWFPKKQRHDITASEYYGTALTNDSKVVIAEFDEVASV